MAAAHSLPLDSASSYLAWEESLIQSPLILLSNTLKITHMVFIHKKSIGRYQIVSPNGEFKFYKFRQKSPKSRNSSFWENLLYSPIGIYWIKEYRDKMWSYFSIWCFLKKTHVSKMKWRELLEVGIYVTMLIQIKRREKLEFGVPIVGNNNLDTRIKESNLMLSVMRLNSLRVKPVVLR